MSSSEQAKVPVLTSLGQHLGYGHVGLEATVGL